MAETMQQLLRERLEDDKPGVLYGDMSWSWREHLAEASAEAAAVISLADPTRPLHVGVLLGNTPDMLRSMAAAALGGYVLGGLNTTRRADALLADVRRADCQMILVNGEHAELLDGLDLAGIQVVDVDSAGWAETVASAGPLEPHAEAGAMDTFMMIFTSGTSGEPKAVQVPHIFPLFAGANLVDRFSLTADDVCYVSMPLFHSNAVVAGWAVAVSSGAAIVPARFSASRFLDDVRHYGATYMNYVGKPLAYVLATPEQPDDADNPLRVAFGNEASDRDIEQFAQRFGCHVMDGFGSTESAITVTRVPGTPRGSIGQGLEGVAIYDAETITECAVAEFDANGALLNADEAVGELVNTQGAGFFQGYYNDPAANEERMRHGMYWSGDLAY
jgi:fatty-acyl-CoA synthase